MPLIIPQTERAGGEKRVIVLGSTGSIGTQTLEVIAHLNALHAKGEWPLRYRVVGLATGRNVEVVSKQAAACGMQRVAVAEGGTGAFSGPGAAEKLVRETACDLVVAAMVGESGLPATLAAVEMGVDVALANKETLVAAGALIVPAAQKSGAKLLPIDSEHCAIWQCLACRANQWGAVCPPMGMDAAVSKLILTASGGPFRLRTLAEVREATVAEALKHPNWTMGRKVTIDSATMMNKALEVVEAHWLFGAPEAKIGVVIHPQSIVHSLVEFVDGSVMAQLGTPDMKGPIQYALSWPGRAAGSARALSLTDLGRLDFAPADETRFEALALARRAIREGGSAGAVLNAANEEAVTAFLEGVLPFGAITEVVRAAMDGVGGREIRNLADVAAAGAEARRLVRGTLKAGEACRRT